MDLSNLDALGDELAELRFIAEDNEYNVSELTSQDARQIAERAAFAGLYLAQHYLLDQLGNDTITLELDEDLIAV